MENKRYEISVLDRKKDLLEWSLSERGQKKKLLQLDLQRCVEDNFFKINFVKLLPFVNLLILMFPHSLMTGDLVIMIPIAAVTTTLARYFIFDKKAKEKLSPDQKTDLVLNKVKNGWAKEIMVSILLIVLGIACKLTNVALAPVVFGVAMSFATEGMYMRAYKSSFVEVEKKIQTISEQENFLKSEIKKAKTDLDKTLTQTDVKENQKAVEKQTESTQAINSHNPVQAAYQYQCELEAQLEQIAQTTENLGRQKKIHRSKH